MTDAVPTPGRYGGGGIGGGDDDRRLEGSATLDMEGNSRHVSRDTGRPNAAGMRVLAWRVGWCGG